MRSAGMPNLFVAIVILPIVNSFLFLFAGVLNPSSSLPYFWRVCQERRERKRAEGKLEGKQNPKTKPKNKTNKNKTNKKLI
jgi:hypothetical protein